MADEYLTKSDIIDWIEDWTNKNPNATKADIVKFAEKLNEQMLKLDYKVPNGGIVIGYAGRIGQDYKTGIFNTIDNIVQNSNGQFCFINNSAENILNDQKFNDALKEAVGEKNASDIIGGAWNGDIRSKYSFGDTLSLNDLVSDNFMLNNAKGDVYLIIADNARIDSTLNVTEIERLLKMEDVKSINGIEKSKLLSMTSTDRFNILKEQSVIDIMDAKVYRNTDGFEILSFEGTKYESIFKTNISPDYINVGRYAERAFVSDSELFSKYSFLNESVSQSILDEFRVGEYRLKTTGVDTLTNATVYFDVNGKVVSVRNHVSDSVFKTTIGDIRNYIPEDELRAVFPEYDSLDNLEKLKVRQLELEYNKFIKNLDSIPVEQISDVRANYLKAVGKTEDTLGFFDKRILKLLEGKLSVLKDRFI